VAGGCWWLAAGWQGCNVFKKSHVFLVMSFWSLKK
jgi:hypothetical protein